MAEEFAQGSVPSDGNVKLWFVPTGEGGTAVDPLSVATLTAPTTKAITYSLTPDGWAHTTTENVIEDGRLALKQMLELPGNVTDALEITYVYGAEDDVANIALAEGARGYIVARYAVDNAEEPTTGQKVDVFTVRAGVQRKNAPTANGVLTKSQKLFQRAAVQRDVVLTA
jgi:hypothetical protein